MPGVFDAGWWRALLSHGGRRRILENIGWLTGEWVLLKITMLLSSVILARYLGPSDFGRFGYSFSIVQLFLSIASMGLTSVVIRELVERPSEQGALLGTAFGLKVIGGTLAALCAVLAVMVLRPEDTAVVVLVAVMSVRLVFWAFETFDFWFQSQVRSKYKVLANNSAMVLYLVAVVVLVYLEAPLLWFGFAMVFETLLYALGMAVGYSHAAKGVGRWTFSAGTARRLMSESWPYIFSAMAIMVYMRIDQIMLGSLASDAAVGYYAVAARFSEGWYLVPRAFATSVFPSLVEARAAGEEHYYSRFGKGFAVLSVLSIGIALAVMFLAKPLVTVLFGDAYYAAAGILRIHVWAGVAVFMGNLVGQWVVIERRQHFMMYTTALGAVLNVLLNFWFIPLWGGSGAALATLISYSCTNILACGLYAPSRRLWFTMMRAMFMPWTYLRGAGR